MSLVISLPDNYRLEDVFAYFARDPQQLCERVEGMRIRKALLIGERPCELDIAFRPDSVKVSGADRMGEGLAELLGHWLGLDQDVSTFEARHASDPILGPLITARPGLRIVQGATPFETLCWAVIGQLISVKAAVSIRARLLRLAGVATESGMLCHPSPEIIADLSEEALRGIGLTQGKATTLLSVSRRLLDGEIDLDLQRGRQAPDALRQSLLAQKGIGPWTAEYVLLRGFACADCSLHGDVAVRNSLQARLQRPDKLSAAETQAWLAGFSPYRSFAAAHLWAAAQPVVA